LMEIGTPNADREASPDARLAEIEKIVNQALGTSSARDDSLERLGDFRLTEARVLQGDGGAHQDRTERVSQIMTYDGEELLRRLRRAAEILRKVLLLPRALRRGRDPVVEVTEHLGEPVFRDLG